MQVEVRDLLTSGAAVLVCPVNCVGVMGAGVALQFKQKWPFSYFKDYADACRAGRLTPGTLHVWKDAGSPTIISFPTKLHFQGGSRLEWIDWGLEALRSWMEARPGTTLALPLLGAGLGGLPAAEVQERIVRVLEPVERAAGWRVTLCLRKEW